MNTSKMLIRISFLTSRRIALATAAIASCVFSFGADVATVASVAAAAPEMGVSLRGVAQQTIEEGEALRIAVRLESPAEARGTIILAPAAGSWVDAIAVELVNAGTGVAAARAEVVGQPLSSRATLDSSHVAGGLWRIRAEAMAGVAPGKYFVRARLEISSGDGWKGRVSDETNLEIVAPSADPARRSQRLIAQANEALLAGTPVEAARLLDAELEKNPDNMPLLTLRARIALRAGNPLAAQSCVNRALRLLPSDLGHPSRELEELQSEIMASSLSVTPAATGATPPAWTWPPRAVLALPDNPAPTRSPEKLGSDTSSTNLPTPAAAPRSATTPSPGPVSAAATAAIMGVVVPAAELIDAKIIADAAGQWAASATAGSQYGRTQYSATQATGAPNINTAGNSPDAWCPAGKNTGTDWLEVTFAKPVPATEVRVRQNDTVGAITKIEAIEPAGTVHVWWEGVDPYTPPAVREIAWFAVRVPKTSDLVARVKITLNLAANTGWKEIDAVQLVGAAP